MMNSSVTLCDFIDVRPHSDTKSRHIIIHPAPCGRFDTITNPVRFSICFAQVQDIKRQHVPLPGGDARRQDLRAGHRHGGRVLDAVRGAQAVRVAAAVGRRAVPGAAGRAALAVRARGHHARAVRAPQPARAPRAVPRVLPAEAVQQLLRQRAQRDRRLVRGRAGQTGAGRRGRRAAARVRPLVRPARRHLQVRRQGRGRVRARFRCRRRSRHGAVSSGDRGGARLGRRTPAHRHGHGAQLVLQQRQRHHAGVVRHHRGLTTTARRRRCPGRPVHVVGRGTPATAVRTGKRKRNKLTLLVTGDVPSSPAVLGETLYTAPPPHTHIHPSYHPITSRARGATYVRDTPPRPYIHRHLSRVDPPPVPSFACTPYGSLALSSPLLLDPFPRPWSARLLGHECCVYACCYAPPLKRCCSCVVNGSQNLFSYYRVLILNKNEICF